MGAQGTADLVSTDYDTEDWDLMTFPIYFGNSATAVDVVLSTVLNASYIEDTSLCTDC